MCGIAGIVCDHPCRLGTILAMTSVQAHRGPDGVGHVFIDGDSNRFVSSHTIEDIDAVAQVALGHRRLSIIDCSNAGLQPMKASFGNYWITYNGEIYNYVELRRELKQLGFQFHTGTDTEVILAAWRAWGTECFSRFNGMWGLAIWDGVRRRIILARDRLGVKPLHYAKSPAALVFASEIKSVLASGFTSARLNRRCASDFIKWGSVNHSEETFFENVFEFPPGHFAEVDPNHPCDWETRAFWRLSAANHQEPVDPNAAPKLFRELFLSAVSLRMRSDVPVGSCLSGGLDSSSIVCAASKLRNSADVSFHTFTSCSHDPRFDERKWSDLVGAHVRSTAHNIFPDAGGFLRDLPKLLWHQEEPFTTTSIYAQWLVMQSAREAGVPVLLDGQGADEILCGYRKYQFFYLRELAHAGNWLQFVRALMMLMRFGDRGLWRWREGERYLPNFLKTRLTSADELIHPDFNQTFLNSKLALTSAKTVADRQIEDLLYFSLPSLLRYEDRNSMAWAVESRVPFLDYRIVEFLVALPAQVKLAFGRSKAVLRTAFRGLVPDAVLDRRDKMGFVTPQTVWLRSELAPSMLTAFTSRDFAAGSIVRQNQLIRLWNNFMAGDIGVEPLIFRIFILDAWA